MNNFYKKYPRKDDVKQIVENSERYFIPDLITLVNRLWVLGLSELRL